MVIEPDLDEYELSRLPGVTLFENTGCKYPLTKSGPHMFCGCVASGSYCDYHAVKCAAPGTVSERRAVRDARRVA